MYIMSRLLGFKFLTLILATFCLGINCGAADIYPDRPVRIIVPYPPGGGVDVVARIIGQRLSEDWSQQVVIDNRGGAGGSIGADIVAKAVPDGYTLLMGTNGPISIDVSLYRNLPYKPLNDFSPVTIAASGPFVLSIHPSIPAISVHQLVALAKSKPRQLTFASAGSGSTNHLAGELLKSLAKIDLVHVPYKGGSTSLADVMSGRVSMIFNVIPLTLPYAKVGKLRPLAVTTAKRFSLIPDIPTMDEAGVPGFEVTPWFGILAPAGTSPKLIDSLYQKISGIAKQRDVQTALSIQGFEAVGNTPDEFRDLIKQEISKWARVVVQTGAQVE